MDKCFGACGCDEFGITTSDLDRFTDKIENVLSDEKGRKLFRNFLYTSKLKDGRKTLNFWEQIDQLLNYKDNTGNRSRDNYWEKLDDLIERAEEIEELDFATMERLINARESQNIEAINEALKMVKGEATHALRREFVKFRNHYLQYK